MTIVRRALLILVAVCGTGLMAGCASTREDDVSTIPWNRPQNWEGSGGLGGFRPPGSPGY